MLLIAGPLGLLALLVAWTLVPVSEWLLAFGEWAAGLGATGVLLITLGYVVGTLLCVPGWPLTLLVAVAYGWWAILISIGGGMLAAFIAFMIGRTIARRPARAFIERHPALKAVDGVAHDESFKTILLARLTPVTPFSVENYAFGVTGVRTLPFLVASLVGILPGTILNVWLGVIGRAAARDEATVVNIAMLALGLVATTILVVWMTRAAKRRLEEDAAVREGGKA